MIAYYFLYLYLAINSFISRKFSLVTISITFSLLLVFLGLRHEIGKDWINYLNLMYKAEDILLREIFLNPVDLGYSLINWIGAQFESIYIVNTLTSFIFLSGLFSYCKRQSYQWLSLIFALPVLILPVGLGFTRQACAVGIVFFALNAIENQKILKSIFLIIIAAIFHFSAIGLLFLFLPYIFAAYKSRSKLKVTIFTILIGIFFAFSYAIIKDIVEGYLDQYIFDSFGLVLKSSGAIPRLIPSLFASLIFIFNKSKLSINTNKIAISIYSSISWLVLIFFFLMILFPMRTTLLDRFAIYFCPISFFVFNRVIDCKLFKISKYYYHLIFISFYFLLSFLWLEFSSFRDSFVPYKNILFL